MPERALIVDADPVWVEALRRWLSAYGLRSISTATSIASANGALTGHEDVVITEVTVARETCFGLVARAVGHRASPVIVAMSDRASRAHVFKLREFGVHAYLEKPFDTATLYRCLEQLASRPRDPDCDALAAPARADTTGASANVEGAVAAHRARYHLTNAEAEILRCILRGMCRVDVARERGISINTVKTQVRSLLWKSGATNVKELVRLAARDLQPRA